MPRPKAERPTYSLTRRGARYYVQWWEGGRAQRISCRTSNQAAARRFLAEFKAGRAAPLIPAAPTLGAILDGYEAERAPHTHSPTLKYCCAALRRHLADLPADLLNKEQVRAYVAARRKEGAGGAPARRARREISDGTLIRELGALRAALAWAVHENWIPTAPHVERPHAPPPRDRWLTRDEAARLLAATVAPHARLFIALALHTAARSGAILQLTWDRVNLTARTIDMGASRGRKRRARHLPINDALRPLLEVAAAAATTQWVIEHGGAPVASIKTAFRAAATRSGIAGVTPHTLRHTAVTWMVQADVPLPMVAAYAAMSQQMVERVYGHHSPDWMRRAAEALSRQVA